MTAAALRLARFNIQGSDRRRQALLRGHAEPGRGRRARSDGLRVSRRSAGQRGALLALPMVLVPGAPDGQHGPLPQLQDARSAGARARSGSSLLFATLIARIVTHPQIVLVVLVYAISVRLIGRGLVRRTAPAPRRACPRRRRGRSPVDPE